MIDKFTVEKIKNAADIVEVVSDYVHLTRRGSNYMGLCPFHNERTPSFSVNRRRNFCYCFSCKKGGSPVNFIMEKEGISYHDALLQLAAKYGIKVEERELTDEEKAYQSERESMFVANDWAMKRMQQMMNDTDEGRDVGLQYFYSRGITEEAIREFRLGYALDRGNLLTADAKKSGFDIEVFRKLGLSGVSQQGREYDRFHGRVIFPILNSSGKAIGFGGRDLKGGPAKYINSPESEIYVKSNELYGIYQAKSEIVRQDKCFLVEGYMDVIGMWQSGMKNVIASSGTALTDGQINLIHRFTENVTILYDGDAAGIKAALRGIDMLLSHKMKVKVLLLPDGKDPDEFARDHTPDEFREYVKEHETDIIRFKTQVLMKDAANDPQKLSAAISSVVQSLASIPDDIERLVYVRECSRIFNVDENTIGAEVAKRRLIVEENLRKERQKKDGNRDIDNLPPSVEAPPANTPTSNNNTSAPLSTPSNEPAILNKYPLEPVERKVIQDCLRFGMMDFCLADEDDPDSEMISVAQYIREELEADDISLSVPVYARILSTFKEYKDIYSVALSEHIAHVQKELQRDKEEAYRELSLKSLSMAQIEKEEKKIEEEMGHRLHSSIQEFARIYSGNIFTSHEDDEMRLVANKLMPERHELSKIYTKNQRPKPIEEDIAILVPRHVIELKNEMIEIQKREVLSRLRTGQGDETELMNRLIVLQKMSKQVNINIGERVINPRMRR